MSTKKSFRFIPVIIAVSVVIGIMIGSFYNRSFRGGHLNTAGGYSNKLNALLYSIKEQYVDTVNMHQIVEDAMPKVLAELDPHSVYIPAKDLESVNSELESSFSGIGVQFTIQNDTVHVISVIPGGPAEKVGMLAGDRIVSVDDSLFVGKKVNNDNTRELLKGPKGSTVRLGVKRNYEPDLLSFSVVRGDIPQKSVEAAYIINDKVGYVQVTKFARNTHMELVMALAELDFMKFKGVIIDLRGNTGGYMDAAIRMVNEFLSEGQLIVYAQGEHYGRMDYHADGTGCCKEIPVVVLIDEMSASSSEIFAGAIQDNDRGVIVGRRSFGKGLVQEPIVFSDNSAVRLTVARYYTPSGRCIQRPYSSGDDEQYSLDFYTRYKHGEFFSQDSIKQDTTQVYSTRLGRAVYGGGGIMPDFFVPQDTLGLTSYSTEVFTKGLTVQFSFKYTDEHRKELSGFKTHEELAKHLMKQHLVYKFITFADSKKVKRRNILIQKSYKVLERSLIAGIIHDVLGRDEYIKYLNKTDDAVLKAVEIIEEGKTFPQALTEKENK